MHGPHTDSGTEIEPEPALRGMQEPVRAVIFNQLRSAELSQSQPGVPTASEPGPHDQDALLTGGCGRPSAERRPHPSPRSSSEAQTKACFSHHHRGRLPRETDGPTRSPYRIQRPAGRECQVDRRHKPRSVCVSHLALRGESCLPIPRKGRDHPYRSWFWHTRGGRRRQAAPERGRCGLPGQHRRTGLAKGRIKNSLERR